MSIFYCRILRGQSRTFRGNIQESVNLKFDLKQLVFLNFFCNFLWQGIELVEEKLVSIEQNRLQKCGQFLYIN